MKISFVSCLMSLVLASAVFAGEDLKSVEQECRALCNEQKCDAAIERAKRFVEASKDAQGRKSLKSLEMLRGICRLANRYEEAKSVALEAIALAPDKTAVRADAANLALEFSDYASLPEIWKKDAGPQVEGEKLVWVLDRQDKLEASSAWRDETLKSVQPFVADRKNGRNQRVKVADCAWLTENTPRGAALRSALADVVGKYGVTLGRSWGRLRWIYQNADWEGFAAVYPFFHLSGDGMVCQPSLRRAHVFSLAMLGRTKEAIELNAKYRAEMKKPTDQLRCDVLLAVIEGRDALPLVEAAKIEKKERIRIIQTASQWALHLRRNDECRRYAAAYDKYLVPVPVRRQRVTFSQKPVSGEAEWRAIYPQLEKSVADVKMFWDKARLETDVATGRVSVEKTAKDSKKAMIEVSACCDVNGVHVCLRVEDPNARAVEDGFAGGKGTEMYFAPGDNEPYICFGGDPHTPISFVFPTAYTSAGHQRLKLNDRTSPFEVRGETWFTDTDYVEHLFFPWDAFYQKLPTAGTEWKFEVLADGFSWGGSQSVHESSSWGRLVFDLKPQEITAIRRRLILRNVKTWNRGIVDAQKSFATVAPFDKWADPVLGDPAFYETVLKPVETELAGYAKRVSSEMTDADVNDIYEHAVPRWIGLRHEIDRLRRAYLLKKSREL